jgi:hypothetical protein
MVSDSVYNFLSESGYPGFKDLQDCNLMVDDYLLNILSDSEAWR